MQAELPAALSADVTVRSLVTSDLARWDAYVNTHPDASFFHRAGWRRVIEEAFGHRTHFLLAERGGVCAAAGRVCAINSAPAPRSPVLRPVGVSIIIISSLGGGGVAPPASRQ